MGERMESRQTTRFFKSFGKRVKEIRQKKRLTQEDMGAHGFPTRFYQRIEAGKPIHLKTAVKLSKAFKIKLSELFRGL